MSQKINTPKGTRDFSSLELKKRDYLLNILKQCFKTFNFQEIQTPSFENLSTLTGKYGDEEDNLIFKILSSGEKIKKADTEALKDNKLIKFSNSLSDKALRYDLTVPLSRFISQNLNNLSFPFKRFQTQLVWRAERPQRGRYREFLQCDVDIIGESNYLNEVECIKVYDTVFNRLSMPKVNLRINNRQILEGISQLMNLDSVNEIASVTNRPEDVIGLHFFSPANIMKLLEIVRGDKTSKTVVATSMAVAKRIQKIAAVVGVCPGFVGNRILAQRQREANKLILEGALPWDIDDALFDFGFPMGPFAMSDLAGLDIGWNKETSNGESIRDLLCEAGRLGQKSGKGFYVYDENRNKSSDPEVEAIIKKFGEERQVRMRDINKEEIRERCLYPMINEGFKILEEGMAIRASDIDIVWTNGYGWPAYEGGPMFYGNTIGFDKILFWLKKAELELGPEFKPSAYLEKVVAEEINIF